MQPEPITSNVAGFSHAEEEDLPHHRVARNFNSNNLSLPATSNFSSNFSQFKTETFSFALANYGAGGLPSTGPSFPAAALQNLHFSHTITANFQAISRNFYEYRRIVITYPSNIQITNIRPNNRVVENFQFNANNNSITINLFPQYEPHTGDVISFNLRAPNGSQVTRRITIN